MCGRFTLTVNPAEAQETFGEFTFPQQFAPRFNIAPTQPILAIPNDDQNTADFFVWGLIPMWAKDPSIGNRMINARGETLDEKPEFRGSLKDKR
jgi:putative SOS response-associated peptidase YedK